MSAGYTAVAFANPTRRILSTMLMSTDTTTHIADRGTATADAEEIVGSVHRRARVIDVLERYVYLPASALVQSVTHAAQRLQLGLFHAHLAYILIAVLAVIGAIAFLN